MHGTIYSALDSHLHTIHHARTGVILLFSVIEQLLGRSLKHHEKRPGPFWENGGTQAGGAVNRAGWQVRIVDPDVGVGLERLRDR